MILKNHADIAVLCSNIPTRLRKHFVIECDGACLKSFKPSCQSQKGRFTAARRA